MAEGPAGGAGAPGGRGAAGKVGVVLVSHSAEVARAVAELARGLAGGAAGVPVAAAGGGPDGGLGTDAELVARAARGVDLGAGVAVLADLGSAVLTVKVLAEDGELPDGTRLVDAPFVEGAVAAVVTSAAGGGLDAVVAAASEAYGYRKV
ncbi:PTS-dependent dihydroxyacetone kinase phosphotransferase subunit DhaM [Streptomyces fradiae]|uniref:PTS-dependent dihydroxyacetone kinase phosphotransferase subunit DhaM n=1 Tax=Streptomyces fradiae TaxID=1906 RepID=UPI0029421417|nr:PTS fructose transporter subunit IIA [Streptomyces fradiae]WOI63726.1 PTS fructose transporter subunit IIA [Streptomyces fradiae]